MRDRVKIKEDIIWRVEGDWLILQTPDKRLLVFEGTFSDKLDEDGTIRIGESDSQFEEIVDEMISSEVAERC